MPNPLTIKRTAKQRRELEDARDHHQKPYMRESAAAMLKIADGCAGRKTHPFEDRLFRTNNPKGRFGLSRRLLRPGQGAPGPLRAESTTPPLAAG